MTEQNVEEVRQWRVVPVPFTDVTTSVQITTMQCRVLSYNLQESSGTAAAQVDIIDGTSTTGIRLARINLATSESKEGDFDPPYVPSSGGLFVYVRAGSVTGTVVIAIPD